MQRMERTSRPHVSQNIRETDLMNRSVALRAFLIFTTITAFAAATGISSQAAIAEAAFLIGGSLSVIMLFLAMSARQPEPVRVRARR
jgi:hypothetical protein